MKIVSSVIIVVIVSAIMKYLMSSSNKQVSKNDDGALVFKMNKAYGFFGILGIIGAGIVGIIASLGTVKTFQDLLMVLFIMLFIVGLCLPLILVARNQKIVVTDEKIIFYSMTGKMKEILWTRVKAVKFNKVSLELKLSANRTSIKLHMHLVGFNKFLELVKKKLGVEIYGQAFADIESVQKRY